jgi:hypothetical protein
MTNRSYKYADELVEGDIIEQATGSTQRGAYGPTDWCMVHKPRKYRDSDMSHSRVVAMLIPLNPELKANRFDRHVHDLFEVATIASHPEVMQRVVDQISALQAEGGREPQVSEPTMPTTIPGWDIVYQQDGSKIFLGGPVDKERMERIARVADEVQRPAPKESDFAKGGAVPGPTQIPPRAVLLSEEDQKRLASTIRGIAEPKHERVVDLTGFTVHGKLDVPPDTQIIGVTIKDVAPEPPLVDLNLRVTPGPNGTVVALAEVFDRRGGSTALLAMQEQVYRPGFYLVGPKPEVTILDDDDPDADELPKLRTAPVWPIARDVRHQDPAKPMETFCYVSAENAINACKKAFEKWLNP